MLYLVSFSYRLRNHQRLGYCYTVFNVAKLPKVASNGDFPGDRVDLQLPFPDAINNRPQMTSQIKRPLPSLILFRGELCRI